MTFQAAQRLRRVLLSLPDITLLNPGTPEPISMPLLAVCTRCELLEVIHGLDAPLTLRVAVQELLARSPPLQERAASLAVQ